MLYHCLFSIQERRGKWSSRQICQPADDHQMVGANSEGWSHRTSRGEQGGSSAGTVLPVILKDGRYCQRAEWHKHHRSTHPQISGNTVALSSQPFVFCDLLTAGGPSNNDNDYDQNNSNKNCPHLAVFPPELSLQLPSLLLKLWSPLLQGVCAIIQLRQLLISLQNFFHVCAHDIHNLIDLGLRLLYPLGCCLMLRVRLGWLLFGTPLGSRGSWLRHVLVPGLDQI